MILPVAVALIVLSVPATGGDLRRLGRLPVRGAALVAGALALQLVITLASVPPALGATVHLLSYGLAALFVAVNRQVPGILIMASGGAFNLLAIAANGGVMPASPAALALAGMGGGGTDFVNSGAVEGARLRWLGDVFAVPEQLPLANVFSIGDVVLVVGLALLLHRACRPPPDVVSPRASIDPADRPCARGEAPRTG